MRATMQMALVATLATALPVWAQGTAATPDPSTTSRKAGAAGDAGNSGNAGNAGNARNAGSFGNAGNAGNAFTIDQKGAKRATAPAVDKAATPTAKTTAQDAAGAARK